MLSRIVEAATVIGQSAYVRWMPVPSRRGADRHLLLVSHNFPPAAVTAAQLPAFLANHASTRGWRVTVACGALLQDPPAVGRAALAQLSPAIQIVRAAGHLDAEEYYPRYPYRLSSRIDGGYAQQVGMSYAAFRALRHDPPTHVFATGPTFNNFTAGRILARRFQVPLILQYRDEWTVMQPSFVDGARSARAMESRCLDEAALITFVTQGKLDAYRAAFAQLRRKRTLVIPNGWDPGLLAQLDPGSLHLGTLRDRLILTFTGRVTQEIPIGPFLTQFASVLERDAALRARLTLCVAGDQRSDTRESLEALSRHFPGAVHLLPPVPQLAAQEILRESSILLLLNNTRYPGVVPLKTFDYMVSGAPILAFGTMGEGGRMVEEAGAGIMIADTSAEALHAALLTLSATPRAQWNPPGRQVWNEANNRSTLNDTLIDAMAQLTLER